MRIPRVVVVGLSIKRQIQAILDLLNKTQDNTTLELSIDEKAREYWRAWADVYLRQNLEGRTVNYRKIEQDALIWADSEMKAINWEKFYRQLVLGIMIDGLSYNDALTRSLQNMNRIVANANSFNLMLRSLAYWEIKVSEQVSGFRGIDAQGRKMLALFTSEDEKAKNWPLKLQDILKVMCLQSNLMFTEFTVEGITYYGVEVKDQP